MPLEKLSWNCPTLGCHWRNSPSLYPQMQYYACSWPSTVHANLGIHSSNFIWLSWFLTTFSSLHDDVIKMKHFRRCWPFVRGIHPSPVISPHKGQRRWAFMFSLICAWINGWVNNGEAGDLRGYCAHYDVTKLSGTLSIKSLVATYFGTPTHWMCHHEYSYKHMKHSICVKIFIIHLIAYVFKIWSNLFRRSVQHEILRYIGQFHVGNLLYVLYFMIAISLGRSS